MKILLLLLWAPVSVSSFLCGGQPISRRQIPKSLLMADISVSSPSPDEAADMGIRDWPQQLRKGSWEETSNEGQALVRYVLDGTGVIEIESGVSPKTTSKISPGSLVAVSGEATLSWRADGEMIILTPGFEEGGKFLGVVAVMLLVFGVLLSSGSL